MKTIQRHYTTMARTEREVFVSGSTVKKAYQTHLEQIVGMLQPLDASLTQDIPGSIGKNWVFICDLADVMEGDKLIVGTDVYKVDGIEKFDFAGINRHMEITLRGWKQ